jgi:hypothetical protein
MNKLNFFYMVFFVFLLCVTFFVWAEEKTALRIQDLMESDQFENCGLHKLTKEELANLDSWLNIYTLNVIRYVSSQKSVTDKDNATINEYSWENFFPLEGTIIIADDGQLLGVITTNEFNSNSIINEFGKYGNKFNANSIFNEFGKYGNVFSSLSPFNQFTLTPPKIYKGDQFIAYLTTNTLLSPRVDPQLLIAWLKANK